MTHSAVVVQLHEWRSSGLCGCRSGDQLIEGDRAASEIADGFHLVHRHPVGLPLRHSSRSNTEVGGESRQAALLGFKPGDQVHAGSLVQPKPPSQGSSKPDLFSIRLSMDADRRRRFIAYFDAKFKGDRAKLIKKTGLTKGRIAQLFDEEQTFGERAARALEKKLGLEAGYLERDTTAPDAQPAIPLLSEDEELLSDMKEALTIPRLARQIEDVRAALAEMREYASTKQQNQTTSLPPAAPPREQFLNKKPAKRAQA